ncbi:uncharacterized protein LOC110697570 [Chenopodium quinoa]|uniref:uncharacterized protein LOC110697570 n=1 Tax=Chenopodium quinoa TaxID=63459 RepID=UPI000B76FC6C|nr:uncharacterized protein LOC110697570 [Chenopodium quinoa]
MKTLIWNCYGLGNPLTVKAPQDWCWIDRSNIVFVMETKIDSRRLELIRNKCGFANGVCVSSNGRTGGLGLWWRDLNMVVASFSAHHIDTNVCDETGSPIWKFIGVYGWPETANKHRTWDLMCGIHAGCTIPMIFGGDFNEILGLHEKSGGQLRGKRQMDAFRDALDECGLRDLGFKGNIFTWERGLSMDALVLDGWCSLFPYSELINFPICHSDHAAVLLKFGQKNECNRKGKLFRFEALWLLNEECNKVVSNAWVCGVTKPIHKRITRVGEGLSSWAGHKLGNIKKRIKKAEKKLQEAQGGWFDASRLALCINIKKEIDELRRLEESYWHTRARSNELRDGDKNTEYFHHKASQRRAKNFISGLYDDSGVWRKSVDDMDGVISDYFGSFFKH